MRMNEAKLAFTIWRKFLQLDSMLWERYPEEFRQLMWELQRETDNMQEKTAHRNQNTDDFPF